MNSSSVVSVRLMVYNHESYLKQAIDGILLQKVNFPVEIVIGDDFSSDESLAIATAYQNQGNFHFKILDRPRGGSYQIARQKRGRIYNFINILENCSGKYIALLDGDDYWCDPSKLQRQVDFLERNEDFQLCGHDVEVVHEGIEKVRDVFYNVPAEGDFDFDFEDEFKNHFVATASVLFRNNTESSALGNFLDGLHVGDIPLLLFLLANGKGHYFSAKMAIKRRNKGSITSNPEHNKNKLQGSYEIWKRVLKIAPKEHQRMIQIRLAEYERALAKLEAKRLNFAQSLVLIYQAYKHNPLWFKMNVKKSS